MLICIHTYNVNDLDGRGASVYVKTFFSYDKVRTEGSAVGSLDWSSGGVENFLFFSFEQRGEGELSRAGKRT